MVKTLREKVNEMNKSANTVLLGRRVEKSIRNVNTTYKIIYSDYKYNTNTWSATITIRDAVKRLVMAVPAS